MPNCYEYASLAEMLFQNPVPVGLGDIGNDRQAGVGRQAGGWAEPHNNKGPPTIVSLMELYVSAIL